ncbi:hypothetical protein LIER_18309 [Lithospermum erythrorhizon]|uniref:Uncharacterized protein n=1 Tax=Lithospermum erythrorhizon TaxID=34254 RepID=A0AAV3QGB1_LITER
MESWKPCSCSNPLIPTPICYRPLEAGCLRLCIKAFELKSEVAMRPIITLFSGKREQWHKKQEHRSVEKANNNSTGSSF